MITEKYSLSLLRYQINVRMAGLILLFSYTGNAHLMMAQEHIQQEDSVDVEEKVLSPRPMRDSGGDASSFSPLEQYLPPSPQAAALARYGEYPVSLATGVPQISIPLYEIKLGNYTLPISISYHASGIKVDDVASTVGLGWVLNAGGAVSRTIMGAADLKESTVNSHYFSSDTISQIINDALAAGGSGFLTNIIRGGVKADYDICSDRYAYNFATKSGVFRYSDKDRRFVTLNHHPIYIEGYGGQDSYFYIIDSDGIVYVFRDKEYVGIFDDENLTDVSSWFLSEIQTPNGNIVFSYRRAEDFETRILSQQLKTGEYYYWVENFPESGMHVESTCTTNHFSSKTRILNRTVLLTKIEWNGGKVSFTYSNDRADIAPERLVNMSVEGCDGTTLKTVIFDNDNYMGTSDTDRRMFLTSLSVSNEGTYTFTYNRQYSFPKYIQGADDLCHTDFWGYYNGGHSRYHIPREALQEAQSQFTYVEGGAVTLSLCADRWPNFNYSKTGILEKIDYPTGGYTQFTYEQNNVGEDHYRGGLRIKNISNYNSGGSLQERRSYSYTAGHPTQISPREAYVFDTYAFPITGFPVYPERYATCSSESLLPLCDGSGSPVFYTDISETNLLGHVTKYHYKNGCLYDYGNVIIDTSICPQLNPAALNDEGNNDPLLEYRKVYEGNALVMMESYNYTPHKLDSFSIGTKLVYVMESAEMVDLSNPAYLQYAPMTSYVKTFTLDSKTTSYPQLGLSTTETYTYDPLFRTLGTKTRTVTNSDGKAFKHVNEYVFESSDTICQEMVRDYCIVDQVVGTKEYCNNTLLSSTHTTFKKQNDWFYPEYYYESTLGGPMNERWHLQDYDAYGNPRTIIENSTDKTALVWGFKSSWPVAKVSGLSYSELQSLGLTSTLNNIANDSIPSRMSGYLTILRNGIGSNGLITAYNYKPLFGVSAITAENDYTTYYDYNSTDGKLSVIRDADGPLQQFSYQYVHPHNSSTTNSTNFVQTKDMLSSTQGKITCQYYDGLGRLVETATNIAGNYVYTMQTYDSKGRVSQEWLPSVGGSSLSYMNNISSISATTHGDNHAYSVNTYDALDRLTFTQTPGDLWHSASKGISKVYGTNVANSVKRYQASLTGSSLIKNGYYPEKTLFMEQTTDEDGKSLSVFTDKQGRKVLERRGTNNDTYFVYDDLNQLRFVLSPEYQHSGYKDVYGYEYRYDEKGRMVKKILPQCEYTQYWYDTAGRMKFMQDANLRSNGLYRFMLYDKFGRLCVQGTCSSCWRGETVNTATYSSVGSDIQNTGYVLTRPSDIGGTVTLEIVNYYDNYNFCSRYTSYPLNQASTSTTTGLLTGTIQKTSDGDNLLDAFYYDFKGRITANRSIRLSHLTTTTTSYNYWGAVSQTNQIIYPGINTSATPLLTINTTNSYNTNGLLTSISQSVKAGSGTVNTRTISSLDYDGLGRVISNSRSGNAGTISYDYNPRGWITKINGKGFSEWLHYADSINPHYNGNISIQMWKAYGDTYNRGYQFSYDGLNRLTEAIYGENNFGKHDNRYNEKVVEYSANSMMKRFQRRGLKDDGQYGKVDNLHIYLDGNRPEKITDDADLQTVYGAMEFRDLADLPQEYYYDGNGSLVADANKGIAHIDYDNLNYPKRIQFTNGNTIEYVYAPDGQKLRATYQTAAGNVVVPLNTTQTITASTTSQTDYIGNVILSGTSSGTSTNVTLDKYLFVGGYASFPTPTTSAVHYYTQDHLGNNRSVVNESGTVEQVTHYYPFGGVFADAGTGSSLQPYKYNGKELDRMHGLDLYDYGARHYDAIVPMFTQVDPLCEKYYSISPYAYCNNNPVNAIDPNGMDWLQARGDSVFWYGGELNDMSELKYTFASTSGYAEYDENGDVIESYQKAEYQFLENLGPTPEGVYEINLEPSPTRHAKIIGNQYIPNNLGGIEMTEYEENGIRYSSSDWGHFRARLTPISVNRKIKRNIKSFYLHDSKKGYTHGCIEVESLLFDFLINYREDKSSIKLKVQYPSLNHITNGGTRRL